MEKNLSGDELKLVRYKILFVKRDHEVVLEERDELLSDDMSDSDFVGWKIADFMGRLAETPVPQKWIDKKYPREFANKLNPMIGSLESADKKYLRVYFEILDRYPREEFHYQERQVEVLEEIREAIKNK